MGMTSKPCPGCGEPGPLKFGGKGRHTHRDADGVCAHCQVLLNEAREARRRVEAESDMVRVPCPRATHWIKFPWMTDPSIHAAFHELANVCGSKGRTMTPLFDVMITDCMCGRNEDITMPKQRAEALKALYDAICLGMRGAYDQGLERGGSLLLQLADGDLSSDEFNRRVFKG